MNNLLDVHEKRTDKEVKVSDDLKDIERKFLAVREDLDAAFAAKPALEKQRTQLSAELAQAKEQNHALHVYFRNL